MADELSGTVETGSGFSVGGVQQSSGSADPFADVQREIATRIAEAIVTTRIPVKIIGVQGNGVLVLNEGDVFVGVGDVLAAYSVGESFVNPDTGEVLGSEEQLIGQVAIVSTTASSSKRRRSGNRW